MCMDGDIRVSPTGALVPWVVARVYIGIADGMSIARVWTCRYSK